MFQTIDPATAGTITESRACAYNAAADADLLDWVARFNDAAAFEELYTRHVGAVTTVARQVCRTESIAEEIAQQAFMALWQRAGRMATKAVRVRPWLTTVARNAAIDAVRSSSWATVGLDEATTCAELALGPEELALEDDAITGLHRALESLPSPQRAAIELVYFRGMTFQAAAAALGIAVGTVKSRVRLAIEHLRAQMCAA